MCWMDGFLLSGILRFTASHSQHQRGSFQGSIAPLHVDVVRGRGSHDRIHNLEDRTQRPNPFQSVHQSCLLFDNHVLPILSEAV